MNVKYIDSLTKSITIFNYAITFSFILVMFISYQMLKVDYLQEFFAIIGSRSYADNFTVFNVFSATLFYGMFVKFYAPLVIIVLVVNIIGRTLIKQEFKTSFTSLVASIVFYYLSSVLIIEILTVLEVFMY